MAETLEFNDIYQEVKGSMVRRAWASPTGGEGKGVDFLSVNKSYFEKGVSIMCTSSFPNKRQ